MLLARRSELELAHAALRRAQAGNGALVLISGPLGGGKSALLDAVHELAAAAGSRSLRASATLTERDYAFGVVHQLLEPALRRAPARSVERWMAGAARYARPALAGDPLAGHPPDSDAAAETQLCAGDDTVSQGITALVESMSRDRLLVLLVDDLQWGDPASLHWLGHLVKRLPKARILLVCTVRSGDLLAEQPSVGEVVAQSTHTLRLKGFDLDNSRRFVLRHWDEPPDEEFVVACHNASAGNPLFLASIVEEAVQRGLQPTADDAALATRLRPELLRQRLLVCLEAQSDQVRRVARAIAVLGESAHLETVGRLAGLAAGQRDHALRALSELGLTKDRWPPRFVHSAMRDMVKEGMPLPERVNLHNLAAELLYHDGRPAEEVAEQLMATTAPLDPWATQALRMAASDALRAGGPQAAARYLRRALLGSPQGILRARLLVDLATSERSYAPAAAMRHISQAVPLLDSALDRAEAVARLAPSVRASTMPPVTELLRQIARELFPACSGPENELALRLEARLRQTSLTDPEQLADSVQRLHDLGHDPAMGTAAQRELLATLLTASMIANALPAAEVARLCGQILEREPASLSHVHTALPLVVTNLVVADSLQSLVPWLDRARQAGAREQTRMELAQIHNELALVAHARGNLAEARALAIQAFELTSGDSGEVMIVTAMSLTVVAAQLRDRKLADRLLAHRYRVAEEPYLWALLTMLKGMMVEESDPRSALEYFLKAGNCLEQFHWRNPALIPWASCAALMHHHLGEHQQAAELSEQEVARATTWGAAAALGRSLIVNGQVTDGPPGVAVLRDAVDVLETSANRFELGKSLLALGERLGPASSEGYAALRRAQTLGVQCGAAVLVKKASQALGEARLGPAPTRSLLTPAERKVAQLAASGLTNQAIAEELSISCRAVEKHLTKCYRKMSIKGRSFLGAALRRLEMPEPSD